MGYLHSEDVPRAASFPIIYLPGCVEQAHSYQAVTFKAASLGAF